MEYQRQYRAAFTRCDHVKDGQATLPQVTADLIAHDVTLAISLEPKNGSPTGQPTGAVLYTGKIVQG